MACPFELVTAVSASGIAGTQRPGRSRRGRIAQAPNQEQSMLAGLAGGRAGRRLLGSLILWRRWRYPRCPFAVRSYATTASTRHSSGRPAAATRSYAPPGGTIHVARSPFAHTPPLLALDTRVGRPPARGRRRTRSRAADLWIAPSPVAYATNTSPEIGRPGLRNHRRTSFPCTGNAARYVPPRRAMRRLDVADAPTTSSRATPDTPNRAPRRVAVPGAPSGRARERCSGCLERPT
jgi:hypothetical protein